MKIGAWIHSYDDVPLAEQVALAAEQGLRTVRSYHIGYAERIAPILSGVAESTPSLTGMTLLGGMSVSAEELLRDWRTQVRLDELARYHELGVPLEAICVGNELREGGDDPGAKRFTARLSFGLANVLSTYREWLDEQGYTTPVTYAMEGIVFDDRGYFDEWLWPLIDACDIVSLNAYPLGHRGWFTFDAFDESRRFLQDARERNLRLARFELHLRRALEQLRSLDKLVILSETGFPSAIGYHMEGERLVVPESDNARYGEAMTEFITLISRVNSDYGNRIRALYFYEWRDNLHHPKIWNVEQSPIHVAFGLCNRFGVPKFDIQQLVNSLGKDPG